jgi:hypothetical protein
LSLPEPVKGTILAPKPWEIWRMSGNMIKTLLFIAALLVPGLASGASPSPTANLSVQVVPAQTSGGCSITGQAATDAAAAGYNTCAFFNDFTATTGANWVPSFPGSVAETSNWLNCTSADTDAVWNFYQGNAPCPGSYSQVNDGGTLAWQLNYNSSHLASGQTNLVWLGTIPAIQHTVNINTHTFSAGYFEWTYRVQSDSGNFPGNVQGFWTWECSNCDPPWSTNYTFVDLEIEEDWATGGSRSDWGMNQWLNGAIGTSDVGFYSFTNTSYHTIGVLLTGNLTAYAACSYQDGVRTQCFSRPYYDAPANITNRLQIYLWNGTACGYDQTNISCVSPLNFGNSNLLIKNIKVITCAAEVASGSCINNTNNGTFFVPP